MEQMSAMRKRLAALQGEARTYPCGFNKACACGFRRCDRCGWNPVVAEARTREFQERRLREACHG